MVTTAFCVALAVLFLSDIGTYVGTYGVEAEPATGFLARRMAPVFAGLAVVLYMIRDAGPSAERRAVCLGMAVVFGGVAVTGVLAYSDGVATFAILVAALVEIVVAALFVLQARAR